MSWSKNFNVLIETYEFNAILMQVRSLKLYAFNAKVLFVVNIESVWKITSPTPDTRQATIASKTLESQASS